MTHKLVAATVPGPETVLGSFPSQISDVVPIGVELGVKPDVVGNDRVLLELQPTFQDFEGNINYGANIYSVYASRPNSPDFPRTQMRQLILTNVINQPVFIKRDLTLAAHRGIRWLYATLGRPPSGGYPKRR